MIYASFNSRVYSTTKFSPYEIMEKSSEKLMMNKVRENTLNSRKTKKNKEVQPGQVVFVINKVVQPNKEMKYLNYYKPTISKKENRKSIFIVKAKIIDEKRNYCKVEIISKQEKNNILELKEIWKISKEALKELIIYNINRKIIVFIFDKKGLEFRMNTF